MSKFSLSCEGKLCACSCTNTDTFTTVNINISVNNTLAEVCVACELVGGIGCYVTVNGYNDINFTVSLKITALNGSNYAVDCIHNLLSGLYQLSVFDLDVNGNISKLSLISGQNFSIQELG